MLVYHCLLDPNLIYRNSNQANTTKDEILLEFAQNENSVGRKNECILVGCCHRHLIRITFVYFYVFRPRCDFMSRTQTLMMTTMMVRGKLSKFCILKS